MGTYGISPDEFLDGIMYPSVEEGEAYTFEKFLEDFLRDVGAETIAEAFNKLADKNEWQDKLKAYDIDEDVMMVICSCCKEEVAKDSIVDTDNNYCFKCVDDNTYDDGNGP